MPRDLGPHTAGTTAGAATGAIAGVMAGVVVPLRSFVDGKARLASRLDAGQRAQLVRDMANRVVDAAGDRPIVIVSNAPEVCTWAAERCIDVISDPGSLDAAARAGVEHLRGLGCSRVVIAHGDLPFATTFDHVAGEATEPVAVIVPCHRHDGTPVLAIPTDVAFTFSYGPGSFARHCDEARSRGLDVRIVEDPSLAFDVDVPADLDRLSPHVHAQP